MSHRQFFKLISRKVEYVKAHCKVGNNPFLFACRRWNFYNQTNYRHSEYKFLQKHHWPTLMSIFLSSSQGAFLVMFPVDLVNFFKLQDIDSSPI